MKPKGSQKGAKGSTREPEEAKSEPKGNQREPKDDQKRAKGQPKLIKKQCLEKGAKKAKRGTKNGINFGTILGAKNLQKCCIYVVFMLCRDF